MSAYLARLKSIVGNNFTNITHIEPTKPTEGAFDGFDGLVMGQIVKNNSDIEIKNLNDISKKCTIGEPTEPSKAYGEIISNWWLITFAGLEPIQVAIWPPCNYADAMAFNPTAIDVEPITSPVDETVDVANNLGDLNRQTIVLINKGFQYD